MRPTSDHGHVALLSDRLDLVGGQPVERSTIRHRLDEIPAGLRSVVLQLGAVHGCLYRIWMRSLLAMAFSSSLPRGQGSRSRRSRVSRYVSFTNSAGLMTRCFLTTGVGGSAWWSSASSWRLLLGLLGHVVLDAWPRQHRTSFTASASAWVMWARLSSASTRCSGAFPVA